MIKGKTNVNPRDSSVRSPTRCSFSDVIIDKDQDINALLQDGECLSLCQFKDDDSYKEERIDDLRNE